jgi:N-acetylglucosaminyldiphosphoundecaprenol N-acetyl-beta-D-mannosaminyltransferase
MSLTTRSDDLTDFSAADTALPSLNVLGIAINAISLDRAASTIVDMARQEKRSTVAVAAVHSVVDAQDMPEAKSAMKNATLCVPDGVPLVWLLRLNGFTDVSRVFGPDLMLETSRLMGLNRMSAYYFGGREGVADDLARRLEDDYAGLRTAGTCSPPFREMTEAEKDRIADTINAAGPDVVWIGLGSPKQERWMAEFRTRLKAPVIIGIGAAFDYNTGRLTRAPRWMQKCALEWLYRLIQEPRRLWRRYLRNNPLFLWFLFCQRYRLKSF